MHMSYGLLGQHLSIAMEGVEFALNYSLSKHGTLITY